MSKAPPPCVFRRGLGACCGSGFWWLAGKKRRGLSWAAIMRRRNYQSQEPPVRATPARLAHCQHVEWWRSPFFEARICFALSPGGPCARPKVLQAEKHNPRHDAVKRDAEKKAKQPDLDQRLRRKAGENDGGLTTRRREKVEHVRVQPWSAAMA